MRCFKVCLIFAEDSGEGSDEAGAEQAVWVVEVRLSAGHHVHNHHHCHQHCFMRRVIVFITISLHSS